MDSASCVFPLGDGPDICVIFENGMAPFLCSFSLPLPLTMMSLPSVMIFIMLPLSLPWSLSRISCCIVCVRIKLFMSLSVNEFIKGLTSSLDGIDIGVGIIICILLMMSSFLQVCLKKCTSTSTGHREGIGIRTIRIIIRIIHFRTGPSLRPRLLLYGI